MVASISGFLNKPFLVRPNMTYAYNIIFNIQNGEENGNIRRNVKIIFIERYF